MPDNLRPPLSDVLCALAAGALCEAERDRTATHTEVARAVLAAVLPAHRAMVLGETADAIETLLDRYHQDLTLDTPQDTAAYRAGRGAVMDAAALVRHLAATAPPVPPAPTVEAENGPAVPEARAVPIEDLIEEIGAADPEFRAAVERTERESLRSENTRLRDLVRRYEGTGDDSKLTYTELEQERDRLAVDLYRAQDCGHDLDAFQRQAEELARLRGRLDVAQTAYLAQADELADTVRRWEPVIEAAKAVQAASNTVEIDNALNALEDAVAALGDAPDPDESQPMFGNVSEEDMRSVAWTSGGGIRSADLKVEFEGESGGSSTADPTSPTDTESGQRGRDEDARCSKCGNPLTPCVTCGKPAGCGDSWCADCVPAEPAGTETADDLAEIDTTEADLDRMMAEGEPVEVVGPAQTFATSDPINRAWPPSGYLCFVRGKDCPGHPSKWMTCEPAGSGTDRTGDADVR